MGGGLIREGMLNPLNPNSDENEIWDSFLILILGTLGSERDNY